MDNSSASQWPQWIEAISTALAAFVALGTVLYFEIWLPRRNAPKLDIEPLRMSSPDCFKIPYGAISIQTGELKIVDSYFLRFRVINKGRKRAENVEVFASKLTKLQANSSYEEVASFLPMHLNWSSHPKGNIFVSTLSRKMYRHCDLAHIINPNDRLDCHGEAGHRPIVAPDKTVLSFETIVKPNSLSHLQEPGRYRLTVVIAANNFEPIEKCLEIYLSGEWFDDETRMLSEGVGVRVVQSQ